MPAPIEALGLIASLLLLIVLVMRGMNLLIAAPMCALLLAVISGLPLFPQLVEEGEANFVGTYMDGFADFVSSWFLMFLLGAIFGKVMQDTRAAEAVSKYLMEKLGPRYTIASVVGACGILTYGGVSLFIVGFTVFPIALALWRMSDYPRRFIPATLAFGSVTFTMTSAGSPEIQNWIPIDHLGTSPLAGWEVSFIVAVMMIFSGYYWLKWMVKRAVAAGERYDVREGDPVMEDRDAPNPFLSLIPLAIVLALSLSLHHSLGTSALIVALTGGVVSAYLLGRRFVDNIWETAGKGTEGALLAIANTAAVVGFGWIARETGGFHAALDFMMSVGGEATPLVGAAISVLVIVGLTGSSSGGMDIVLPEIGPSYTNQGVDPNALHRVSALSSGALDSLPHGGYTVTNIRIICGETHKVAYPAAFATTVVVPLAGAALAVVLFTLGL